jgi:hypothetical protein
MQRSVRNRTFGREATRNYTTPAAGVGILGRREILRWKVTTVS